MAPSRTYFLTFIALMVLCFGLAAKLAPQLQAMDNVHPRANDFFGILLGDSRRLFANQFFVEADVYYHSGYYPTIFNTTKAFETPHMAADTGAIASHNQDEKEDFMGPTRDWIDAFGRHFMPDRHTHLDEGGPTGDLSTSSDIREILPWLKLSAELDPENVKTYVVTAFWLRTRMGKTEEAEQVLREGLKNNPNNPQLLFELGRAYFESADDRTRARNIWDAALRSWKQKVAAEPESKKMSFDDRFIFEQIQTYLARLETEAGNFNAAISHWESVKSVSPDPSGIQKQIDGLRARMAASGTSTNAPAK